MDLFKNIVEGIPEKHHRDQQNLNAKTCKAVESVRFKRKEKEPMCVSPQLRRCHGGN